MKNLTIFDPNSAEPRIDEGLGRLDEAMAKSVAGYLSRATMIVRTTQRVPDALSNDGEAVVPISTYTDGVYLWSEAVTYYIREYAISPGDEFVEHCQKRQFRPPSLSEEQIQQAIRSVMS